MRDQQANGDVMVDTERPSFRERAAEFLARRDVRISILSVLGLFAAAIIVLSVFYIKYAHRIDARLANGPFIDSINIYASPRTVSVGDPLTLDDIVARLRRSGYTTAQGNAVGWYNVRPRSVEIFPGRDSFAGGEPGVVYFEGSKVARIVSLADNTERQQFALEPQLLASLSEHREKRRLIRYRDIPPSLIHAVISAEDKHFFHHTGFDMFRILKAAYVDLKTGKKEQGASTLSMQLARGLWLDPDKRWTRKFAELMITLHLEHRLTKEQIFEDYANQVYLGRRGTFSINGFGEGARAYFNKDISQLNNAEAATLAGMVQRPSYFNPNRYPDRVKDRRDLVLSMMRQNGYLTDEEYERAIQVPVRVTPEQSDSMESQYFVDLMNDEVQNKLDENGKARYIYTTLDPDLQAAAEEAVRSGMKNVDQELRKGKRGASIPAGEPQVALIALDPHTGEIKALVGGRDYAASQLNHALAMRQPGSAFKPFVYAAALETGITGGSDIFTPASVVDDSPTAFANEGGRVYQPSNFHHNFMGSVTLRTALAHSLNVATVKLAQEVGYNKVVNMAHRAGLNESIRPTPAVALGAYETTPLEIAGAYTLFANHGMRLTPSSVSLVRAADGTVLYRHEANPVPALDPRIAYLMTNMMQEVLRSGTGAGVRSRGFTLPAAGKTGTSRDGWFAGFTSELLCVVWVGFDDNRDLNLEGARSALPIWAEFMKRAAEFRQYRNAQPFHAPAGVVTEEICADSGQLAGPYCPRTRSEVFIDGTEPVATCSMHSMGTDNFADRTVEEMPATGRAPLTAPSPGTDPGAATRSSNASPPATAPLPSTPPAATTIRPAAPAPANSHPANLVPAVPHPMGGRQ